MEDLDGDVQEKPLCAVFNKLLPMSSDKSVTDVPGLDQPSRDRRERCSIANVLERVDVSRNFSLPQFGPLFACMLWKRRNCR
jgi:hypothetical protein